MPEPTLAKVEAGYRLILEGLGLSLDDPHIKDTPHRAAKAMFWELCAGLTHDAPVVTTFPDDGVSQMVILREIPVKSLCAHHLLPFHGFATVGYIPGNGEVVGLSKLSRMVDYWARRPQVQERLTNQIADFIWERVRGKAWIDKTPVENAEAGYGGGVGVYIRANHLCMMMRGVNHPGDMVTSALRGVFAHQPGVREEFLALARNGK